MIAASVIVAVEVGGGEANERREDSEREGRRRRLGIDSKELFGIGNVRIDDSRTSPQRRRRNNETEVDLEQLEGGRDLSEYDN